MNIRFLPTILFTVAILCPDPICGQIHNWNKQEGFWSDPANWDPFGVPGSFDIAQIGVHPNAADGDVWLDINDTVAALTITNGMNLNTNGHDLISQSLTLVSGGNLTLSDLRVYDSIFNTRDLINDGGRVIVTDGQIQVGRLLDIRENSVLYGRGGTVNLWRNHETSLINDGTIATPFGGDFLTINQLGSGLMDLDGSTGNGLIGVMDENFAQTMTFNGTELSDSFSGEVRLRTGNILDMNLTQGWTVDEFGVINIHGDGNEMQPARILGGDLQMNGSLNLITSPAGAASGRIEAQTVFGDSSSTFIESGNALEIFGNSTVNAGSFELQEDASLTFANHTLVKGGTFTTHSDMSVDGAVHFDGLTAWDGNVTVTGVALQNGNAIVAGETVVNADIFDMDGLGGTNWNVADSLTINANGIDSTISNSFDGTINVFGGSESRLEINLDQPDEHWTMAGELNLINTEPTVNVQVSGSRMRLTGDLHANGSVAVQSDLIVASNGSVAFEDQDSELYTQGQTLVQNNALFVGNGTLINDVTGELTLSDGVSLNDVGLVNNGILSVDASAGIADVEKFVNTEDATFQIDIGGYILGDEHDALLVGDGATTLDGLLEVSLIDTGNGLFTPELGDEFTFILSQAGVFGTFDNSPVSEAAGRTYHWGVQYNAHDATLYLKSISVPEPQIALIVAIMGILASNHRRRLKIDRPNWQ